MKSLFYDNNTIHGNYDVLNEPLIGKNVDIQFIYYLGFLIIFTTTIFLITTLFSFLLSILIQLNVRNAIYFFVYGFFITTINFIIFGNYTDSYLNLTKYEFTVENKLTTVLFIFGISLLFSPLFYLFNIVSYFISLSIILNFIVSIVYIYIEFKEKINIDVKIFKEELKIKLYKLLSFSTLFVSIFLFIFNKNINEILTILILNVLSIYIYTKQLTNVINNSEEFYYNEHNLFYHVFYNIIIFCSKYKIDLNCTLERSLN